MRYAHPQNLLPQERVSVAVTVLDEGAVLTQGVVKVLCWHMVQWRYCVGTWCNEGAVLTQGVMKVLCWHMVQWRYCVNTGCNEGAVLTQGARSVRRRTLVHAASISWRQSVTKWSCHVPGPAFHLCYRSSACQRPTVLRMQVIQSVDQSIYHCGFLVTNWSV